MSTCYTGTAVPMKVEEPCNGIYNFDTCTVHETAIPYLNLPVNSTVTTIINTFVLSLMYKDEQVAMLTATIADLDIRIASLEDRVELLENP